MIPSTPITHAVPAAPSPELRKRAAEFEGILLTQFLEKLKDAYRLPGDEETDSVSEGFTSFANSALGRGLAEKDGLGIAKLLVQSLTDDSKGAGGVKTPPPTADVVAEAEKKD